MRTVSRSSVGALSDISERCSVGMERVGEAEEPSEEAVGRTSSSLGRVGAESSRLPRHGQVIWMWSRIGNTSGRRKRPRELLRDSRFAREKLPHDADRVD